jgi:hypothetical protein
LFVIPFPLQNLGVLAWRRGDYDAAFALEREALAMRHQVGDKRGVALTLEGLAWLFAGQGYYERAARILGGTADSVLGVYRDEMEHTDSKDKGLAELSVMKKRQLGEEVGRVRKLVWVGESYRDLADTP